MLTACLELLLPVTGKIVVDDGPAWDAGSARKIIAGHPLRQVCEQYSVALTDLLAEGAATVNTPNLKLKVARMAFDFDYLVSLPVLKSHGICKMTGALKNQLGFLSVGEKRRLHFLHNVHRVIAELN